MTDFENIQINAGNNLKKLIKGLGMNQSLLALVVVGAAGAAEFIENAPHESDGVDIVGQLNKDMSKFRILYWAAAAALIVLVGSLICTFQRTGGFLLSSAGIKLEGSVNEKINSG